MAEKSTELAPSERQPITRRDPGWSADPFRMLERFADEIDSVFDDFGFGRSWFSPRWHRGFSRTSARSAASNWTSSMWMPQVEVYQEHNELVVRVDLPGMKKEDVSIEVTDHELMISGERRQHNEGERGGIYRSERSYGNFYRTLPLPEGAMTDQAKATFKDGVLEVRMPAPPEMTRKRRLEIKEASESKK